MYKRCPKEKEKEKGIKVATDESDVFNVFVLSFIFLFTTFLFFFCFLKKEEKEKEKKEKGREIWRNVGGHEKGGSVIKVEQMFSSGGRDFSGHSVPELFPISTQQALIIACEQLRGQNTHIPVKNSSFIIAERRKRRRGLKSKI